MSNRFWKLGTYVKECDFPLCGNTGATTILSLRAPSANSAVLYVRRLMSGIGGKNLDSSHNELIQMRLAVLPTDARFENMQRLKVRDVNTFA